MLRANSLATFRASILDVSPVLLVVYFRRLLSQTRTCQYWLPLDRVDRDTLIDLHSFKIEISGFEKLPRQFNVQIIQ